MANGASTALLNGIGLVTDKYMSAEYRPVITPALSISARREFTDKSLTELRKAESRTVQFDFTNRSDGTAGTERTHNHTGSNGDTSRESLVWKTFVRKFSISREMLRSNTTSFELMIAKQMYGAQQAVLRDINAWLMTSMLADKTQINQGTIRGKWNADKDVMEIDLAERDYSLEQIKASMSNNEYMNSITIIADGLGHSDMMRSMNATPSNSTNLSWQFGDENIVKTNGTLLADYNGSFLAFEDDAIVDLDWIPIKNRQPIDYADAATPNGSYGTVVVPVLGQDGKTVIYEKEMAISIYATRADKSGTGGSKQDLAYEFEISCDAAYQSQPLSKLRAVAGGDWADKTDSVVYAFGVKKA